MEELIYMKQILFALLLVLATVFTASAQTQPAIIFSQDIVAIDADGNMLPSVKIEPQTMADMQTYNFDLGRQRLLRIETNIKNAQERGLADVVATIERSYNYIESATGQKLTRGILLYLIELDEVPYAYSFRASYDNASQWGEVRLALIDRDAALSGRYAASSLTDLLYDTLPHELGHDVLDKIPQLMHDIDGNASHHTRWFIEGVCEVLAKGFSKREDPALYRQFLSLRNVDAVLADPQIHTALLNWTQDNNNGMVLESDLYGAAMLTLMAWTENLSLGELLGKLTDRSESLQGDDLVAMMKETTGFGPQEMIRRAHSHGLVLNEKVILAKNEL